MAESKVKYVFYTDQNGRKWGFKAISAPQKTHLTYDIAKMLWNTIIVYGIGSNGDVASKMELFWEEI